VITIRLQATLKKALLCIDEEEKLGKKNGNRAGILLGLGLIQDRVGNLEMALSSIREAQKLFRERAAGKPASLVAKAGMSIAKILLKLSKEEKDLDKKREMEEEAVTIEEENVELFIITCGDDSPLTASALKGLGEAEQRTGRLERAIKSFARSYELEAQKDAFDLLAIMEIHNLLVGAHMEAVQGGGKLDHAVFLSYTPTVDKTVARVNQLPQDGNAGAYFKVAGELMAFGEQYETAVVYLSKAIKLFQTEKPDVVAGLIRNCTDLLTFCLSKTASPAHSSNAPPSGGYGGTAKSTE